MTPKLEGKEKALDDALKKLGRVDLEEPTVRNLVRKEILTALGAKPART